MPINLSKVVSGGTTYSYGNQSPATDAVPLIWLVPSFRYNTDPAGFIDPTVAGIYGWQLTIPGTPGTWVAIPMAGAAAKQDIYFMYRGNLSAEGDRFYLAPATADASAIIVGAPIQPGFVADADYTHVRVWGNIPTNSITGGGLRIRVFDNDDGVIAAPIASGVTAVGQTGSLIWVDAAVTITQGNVINICLDRDAGEDVGPVEVWLTVVLS